MALLSVATRRGAPGANSKCRKMVTDDDTPRQIRRARRILYAMAPEETPDVR
jgi:hypothetical protein